ncbi:MAG: tripartite tricarboxylate transporter substrate binding protein [Casimicrobiaceae bacterium]
MKSVATATVILIAAALVVASEATTAQGFPDHPITIVTPYAPGGGTDILVRILAPMASKILGQGIIVDNKPGAATMIGTEQVVRSKPDGYTLLAADSATLINPGLYKTKLPYDTVKSLQGVTMLASAPIILLVNPAFPPKNLKELIALAKSEPGKLNFGSGGIGSGPHLAGELFKLKAGVDIQHVPYNGTSPGVNAVLGGQVQMMFGGISSARQLVQSGKLRAIAVTGEKRNSSMPDVPTFAESGLDVDASSYWGLYAPAGVPMTVLDTISKAFARALHDPDNIKKLNDLGFSPIGNDPREHTRQMHAMIDLWTEVIDRANVKSP